MDKNAKKNIDYNKTVDAKLYFFRNQRRRNILDIIKQEVIKCVSQLRVLIEHNLEE